MSAPTEAPAAGAEGAKKKSKLPLIIIAVVVLAAVGGGGFFFMRKSAAAGEEGAEKSEKTDKSKKKAKAEDEDEEEEADAEDAEEKPKDGAEKKKAPSLKLPDDSKVKEVVELQPFVVNLADATASRYLRVSVSVGMGGEGGGEEAKPDALLTTRIRNAMLAVLTTKTSDDVLTVEGKTQLRKELLKAAQKAADEADVEAIYITEFIVQM